MRILSPLCFCFIVLPFAAARAEDTRPSAESDVDASRLAEFSQHFAAKEFQRFDFVQTKKLTVLSRPLVTEGEMVFARDQGLIWRTTRPVESTLVMSSDGIFKRSGTANEKIDTGKAPLVESTSRIFLSLFKGDFSALEGIFHLRLFGTATSTWRIELSPRNTQVAKYLKSIILRGTERVEELEINEMNGDTALVVFHLAAKDPNGLREDERTYFQN